MRADQIEAVRAFNRFYTKQIGLLQEGLLDSSFTLSEARVLFEIAHHSETTASELADELDMDPGYLSRIMKSLEQEDLVQRAAVSSDRRRRLISLTQTGQDAFADLNARSRHQFERMLARLDSDQRDTLVGAMNTIQTILGTEPPPRARAYILRPHRPGDIGWIIHRHGALYYEEFGWDETFEALVAVILGEFEKSHGERERCWIAESAGEFAGCVFLMEESQTVARLRCLLVEPAARGLGLGTQLVQECIEFARHTGYARLVLWTNDVLHSARHIYERAGFTLTEENPHHSFGCDLVGQTWELDLIS